MNKRLGVRQRRMLTNMAVFGDGRWPLQWKARAEDREVLSALWFRGLVSGTIPRSARLTEEGRAVALSLMSDAEHELAATLTAKRRAGVL